MSSLVGSISPYVFLRGLEPHSFTDRSDEYNKQVKRLNYKVVSDRNFFLALLLDISNNGDIWNNVHDKLLLSLCILANNTNA